MEPSRPTRNIKVPQRLVHPAEPEQRKAPARHTVVDDDVIELAQEAPIEKDEAVPKELPLPTANILPKAPALGAAASAAVGKKTDKPFGKAVQRPTTNIEDQSTEFRFTDGVQFVTDLGVVFATLQLGAYVTLAVPRRAQPRPVFLVVILFRRYNANLFRASGIELNDAGDFGDTFEFPVANITTILAGRPAQPAARLIEPLANCAA